MVSNRLDKVHKAITKKKGKNPNLHENSRDTQRLQRAAGRDDKINRLSKIREKQNRTYRTYPATTTFNINSSTNPPPIQSCA
jgi:translation machinery-associated protein 16